MPIVAGPTQIPFPSGGVPPAVDLDAGPWLNGGSSGPIAGLFPDTGFGASTQPLLANSSSFPGTVWTQQNLSFPGNTLYNWFDPASNSVYSGLTKNPTTNTASVQITNIGTAATSNIAGPSSISGTIQQDNGLVALLPNGSIALVLWLKSGSSVSMNFYSFTGGTWSGPVVLTDVATASGSEPRSHALDILVDSNNVCYIVYNFGNATNTFVKVQTVDASGNLGPVATVVNDAVVDQYQSHYGRRSMLFGSPSQLWVSVVDPPTSSEDGITAGGVSVFRSGTLANLVFPASSPFNFTLSYATGAPAANILYLGPNLVGTSNMFVVFNAIHTVAGGIDQDRMMAVAYSGSGDTWGTLQFGLDWVNNPPGGGLFPYPQQFSHFWSTHQLPDGSFGTFCDFNNVTFCFAYYTNWTVPSGPTPPPSPPVIIINPPPGSPPGTPGNPIPPGTVGVPISVPISPTGGTPPYVCTVISGMLPPGTTLVDCTSISGTPTTPSGTPTQPGPFCFTIQLVDSTNHSAQASACITIGSPPTVTCGSPGPPIGTVGIPYSFTFPATGGIPPLVWAISSGSFPPGLVLNAQTGAVSGTPTTVGTYNFTISATSSAGSCGTGTATCIIIIQA